MVLQELVTLAEQSLEDFLVLEYDATARGNGIARDLNVFILKNR
jgi:hypothetical protein